jgi:hypothetical protein
MLVQPAIQIPNVVAGHEATVASRRLMDRRSDEIQDFLPKLVGKLDF